MRPHTGGMRPIVFCLSLIGSGCVHGDSPEVTDTTVECDAGVPFVSDAPVTPVTPDASACTDGCVGAGDCVVDTDCDLGELCAIVSNRRRCVSIDPNI